MDNVVEEGASADHNFETCCRQLISIRASTSWDSEASLRAAMSTFDEFLLKVRYPRVPSDESLAVHKEPSINAYYVRAAQKHILHAWRYPLEDGVQNLLRDLQDQGRLRSYTCLDDPDLCDGYCGFWESSLPFLTELWSYQQDLAPSEVQSLSSKLPSAALWPPLARRSEQNQQDLRFWQSWLLDHLAQRKVGELAY